MHWVLGATTCQELVMIALPVPLNLGNQDMLMTSYVMTCFGDALEDI